MLLRIVGFGVDFAHQVGDLANSLILCCAQVTSCEDLLLLLEIGSCCLGVSDLLLSEVVSVFSLEVASTVGSVMLRDDCTETLLGRLDGSVDEGKLSDVVLVNHPQNGLLLAHVNLWVLNLVLIRRLKLSLRTHTKAKQRESVSNQSHYGYIFRR